MKKSLYVTQSGELKRKDNTLLFESEEGKRYIPIEDIREIHVIGEVNITKKLLEYCTQKGIILHFYNYHSFYAGSYYPREHYNSGHMLIKQVECYLDKMKRFDLARRFVLGSIENIEQVLKYYANRGKDVDSILEKIRKEKQDAEYAKDIADLMGCEGRARNAYYSAFDIILDHPDFVFEKRSRRPPLNRMNALISLGNRLLYNVVLSEIYHTHLDPRIGFLHTSNFRRFSLNLDIAEIFKPIIVDRIILSMISKKEIQAKDFRKELNGVILKEKSYNSFLRKFDERLQVTIKHRKLKRNVSYRTLIRMEAYKIQKHLIGEEEYQPFKSSW